MYTDFLSNTYRWDIGCSKFKTAFAFISRPDLMEIPVGWIDLDHGVRASVQEYETVDDSSVYYETHDKYIDLQYMVSGEELVGVVPRAGLTIRTAYDDVEDISFYEQPSVDGGVVLGTGHYVILFPDDAHKPRCTASKKMHVKKIVVKIPV